MVGERDVVEIVVGRCRRRTRPSRRPGSAGRRSIRARASIALIELLRRARRARGPSPSRPPRCRRDRDSARCCTGTPSRPAARPGAAAAQSPLTSSTCSGLSQSRPAVRRRDRLLAAGLEQRVRGQRGVPHRRDAGLAIGLVLLDDQQLVERARARSRGADGRADSRARRTSSRELAIAGKIAPSPSSPLSRSVTKATALSIARWRGRFGKKRLERAQHDVDRRGRTRNQDHFWCGALCGRADRLRRPRGTVRRSSRRADCAPAASAPAAPAAARSRCAPSTRSCRGGTETSSAAA